MERTIRSKQMVVRWTNIDQYDAFQKSNWKLMHFGKQKYKLVFIENIHRIKLLIWI